MDGSSKLYWLKLIAKISRLPRGDSDRLRCLLFSLHLLFTFVPHVQIAAATRHVSKCFKGAVAQKCVWCPRSCQALDTCRLEASESSGVFGSGTEFSSEDEEKVYGTLPRECLLLFEAPASVAALILGKDYFISSCFFFPVLFFITFSHLPHLWFCTNLLGDRPLTLALSVISFPMSRFHCAHCFFSPPPLHSLLPLLHRTVLFSFYTSSILPFQHMTDCVINVHHKPLFLLATH